MKNNKKTEIKISNYKIFSIIFCVIGLLLLIFSILFPVSTILNRASLRPDDLENSSITTIEPPEAPIKSYPELLSSEKLEDSVTFTFKISEFSHDTQTLEGDILLEMPDSIKERLWINDEYVVNSNVEGNAEPQLKEKFEDEEIVLSIIDSINRENNTEKVISLSKFFEEETDGVVTIPFVFILSGQDHLYPGDWYFTQEIFTLSPPDLWLRNPASGFSGILPVTYYANSTFSMKGYDLEFQVNESDQIQIFVTRRNIEKTYVYSLVSLPFILELVFAYLILSNKKKKIEDSLLDIAALIFTILPIRSILVPPDVTGLVTLDYILGIEVSLLVCFILFTLACRLWKTTDPEKKRSRVLDSRQL